MTGSNTGIGLETAKELAVRGASVVIACRDQARGEAAVDIVKQYSGHARVRWMALDLADTKSIKKFVRRFARLEITTDYLINNAGTILGYPINVSCFYG